MSRADSILEVFHAVAQTGLRPLSGKQMRLAKNMYVYMGASSSPDGIFITGIDDKYIHYLKYPYTGTPFKIENSIGRDLIRQGLDTWLSSGYVRYHPDTAKKLQKILDGKTVAPDDIKDYRYVSVEVQPTAAMIQAANKNYGGDVWRYIENTMRIGVQGSTIKEPRWYQLSGVTENQWKKIKPKFAKSRPYRVK